MYLPLKVGNRFIYNLVYSVWWPGGGWANGSYRTSNSITKDTIINNKHYYFFNNYPTYTLDNRWIRLDSITHSIYMFQPSNSCPYYYYETLIDSLDIISGMQNDCTGLSYFNGRDTLTVLGHSGQIEKFIHDEGSIQYNCRYHSLFGIFYYTENMNSGSSGYSNHGTLIGCVINGITYGDTTIASINKIITEVPDNYSLSQNYPNPFNPTTNIRFKIVKNSFVLIKIYNIVGKEVNSLVNEKLNAGSYSVEWNASQFPSGVYFYQLRAGDFTETKKMMLIK
jgi:hypothetical protein